MGAHFKCFLSKLQAPAIMMMKLVLLTFVAAEEAQERHGRGGRGSRGGRGGRGWGWGGSNGGSYGGYHGGSYGGSNNWCLSTCGCSGTATTTTTFPPRNQFGRAGRLDRHRGGWNYEGSSWGSSNYDWCLSKCGCSGTASTTTTTTISTFPPRRG